MDKDYFFLRIVTKGTVLTTFVVLSTQQELNKIQNIVISTGRDIEWVLLSKLLNPIKVVGSESMYSLGGPSHAPPLEKGLRE